MFNRKTFLAALVTSFCTLGDSSWAQSPDAGSDRHRLRMATFNASLYGKATGEVKAKLSGGTDPQAIDLAAIVQTVRPDILLLNEIDHDADSATAKLLAEKYFAVAKGDREAMVYPWVYSIASNTGIDSMLDLDGNGRLGDPADAWGFGAYPGQYASAVFSRYPIDTQSIRTFQLFRWADFPNALQPVFPASDRKFYSPETWQQLRLSSKNHADVPIRVGDRVIHVLASHPTPPVFDGPEDRNGCRNHDEILFWVRYVENSNALVDDQGVRGGLAPHATFVVMGDLNSDPVIGDSRHCAIRQLLQHPRLHDPRPVRLAAADQYPKLWTQPTDFSQPMPSTATADFGRVGQLRVDYVLPSRDLPITDAKVFWPSEDDPNYKWIEASDHRLVWVDVTL